MPYLQANGARFHYHVDDYSDPWLPTKVILLHHSVAGNLHRWRPWVPHLARHYRVLRFDMRGHGLTPPPPGGQFSLPELAADVTALLDSLEISKVHLVGASGGGIVGLRFAHDFPERLNSFTIMTSTPKLAQTAADIDTAAWRRILEESDTKEWLLSDVEKRFDSKTDREVVEWYATEGGKTAADQVLGLMASLLGEDLIPLLPQIQAPTLILAAAGDPIIPDEIQHLMARQIPGATLQTFDGVGHNMKVEIPDTLAGHVLRFVRQLDTP